MKISNSNLNSAFSEINVKKTVTNNTKSLINDEFDNFSLYHATKYYAHTVEEMHNIASELKKYKSGWASVHVSHTDFNEKKDYIKNWITVLKLNGLKVLLRHHFTPDNGNVKISGNRVNFAISASSTAQSSATGGSLTTLIDTSKSWIVNQWAGFQAYIVGGTGNGQALYITSNTANTLTFQATNNFANSSVALDNTTKYQINYEKLDRRSFDDVNFGYRKYCLDIANFGLECGADSYSVTNELDNIIVKQVNSANSDIVNNYVAVQKDLVTYIKANTANKYKDGYTATDLFW